MLVQVATLVSAAFIAFAPSLLNPRPAAAAGDDWPTFLHDPARSAASADTGLTTANAGQLRQAFAAKLGGPIVSSPAIVNGTIYVGAWDGFEYALDANTGAVKWKANLGMTTDPPCHPPTIGVTSGAAVVNGVVYVGGGDSFWYALNAANGAVLWKVFTGDNTQAGAHYNWSSPLISGNFAYIGIASNCDNPLVQGQVMKVDLTTHLQVGLTKLVDDGQVGGGVWTSPTIDTATNTIYVTTGTINLFSQKYAQAIVAIDAATMAIKDAYQIPFSEAVSDSDWGNTPTLTVDSTGRKLVSATNKNGILYTFDRANLHQGPVWKYQVAYGGDCPTCGDGSISSAAFANGTLYQAAGSTTITGNGHKGSVRAFNPGTGAVLWQHGTAGRCPGLDRLYQRHGGRRSGHHHRGPRRGHRQQPLDLAHDDAVLWRPGGLRRPDLLRWPRRQPLRVRTGGADGPAGRRQLPRELHLPGHRQPRHCR